MQNNHSEGTDPLEDKVQPIGSVELALLKEYLDEHTQSMQKIWEREKNPTLAMGPYFYAATLTVSSALSLAQQKHKLLKMLHTLLCGKSIAKKYRVVEAESYYVWELTKVGTLHIHLLVRTELPAKHYDIRKVKGMQGANWQQVRSVDAWFKYLSKNLDDSKHIQAKKENDLVDKLPLFLTEDAA